MLAPSVGHKGIKVTTIAGRLNIQWRPVDQYDYFGDDFYLNDQSPCIDAGIDSVMINDELIYSISQEDFYGNAPDIGFMEYELIILLGDVNLDGSINVQDIVIMVAIILDTISPVDDQIIASDINVDGIVDILDIILLVSIILD